MNRFEYQLIVILLFLTSQIYGSCFRDLVKSSNNTSSDNLNDRFCEYGDVKYAVNSTWDLPYPDCLTCQCGEEELECCGYGVEAGINDLPENCQIATGTCKVIFVQKDDPTQPCNENYARKPMRRFKKKSFYIKRKNSTIISYKRI